MALHVAFVDKPLEHHAVDGSAINVAAQHCLDRQCVPTCGHSFGKKWQLQPHPLGDLLAQHVHARERHEQHQCRQFGTLTTQKEAFNERKGFLAMHLAVIATACTPTSTTNSNMQPPPTSPSMPCNTMNARCDRLENAGRIACQTGICQCHARLRC